MKYYKEIMDELIRKYPGKAASEKPNPWQCLLFTALTARSRDEQVEPVFQELVKKFPTAESLSKASVVEVENIISSVGLYRAKSRAAIKMAKMIIEKFDGQVPKSIEDLVQLPGVGRKTASCVMVYSFKIPAIPVDTHVHRIVNRLGWVNSKNPEDTEKKLRKTLPEKYWMNINRVMVFFGREICVPGRPHCYECPIVQWCDYKNKNL